MQTVLYFVISIAVAAVIGGLTNHLAIKMLFHPRQPYTFMGKRVPLTPGLIPKRKDEIADSLGEVVGEYLVTSEGLRSVLEDTEFKRLLCAKLETAITAQADRDESLKQTAERYLGEVRVDQLKRSFSKSCSNAARKGILWLWEDRGWKKRTLAQIIPGWNEDRKGAMIVKATDAIVASLQEELASLSGDRLVRQLAGQFIEQAGGFLGTLAGIFMDEEKMSRKIRQIAIERLDTPLVRKEIDRFLGRKIGEWEQLSLEEVLQKTLGVEGSAWLAAQADSVLNVEVWLDQALQWTWRELLSGGRKEAVLDKVPWVVEEGVGLISTYLERIVAALDLPKLVKEQVSGFPVERLETIVLSVSGREFRAITWLGAVLGGTIGLLQALFFTFVMK